MSDDQGRNDDARESRQVDTMTIAQLKEFRGRKLKVTGNKIDLVTRLKSALVLDDQREEDDDGDNEEGNDESNDERYADADGAWENEARRRAKFVPSFRDVKELIDTFSGDEGRNVMIWIKEFEDLAELCEWNAV